MKKNKLKNSKSKIIGFIKKCPLATLLIISSIVLTLVSLINYKFFGYELKASFEHPMLASALVPIKEEQTDDWDAPTEEVSFVEESSGIAYSKEDTSIHKESGETTKDYTERATEIETPIKEVTTSVKEKTTGYPTRYKKKPSAKARSPYYNDVDKIALTTDCPYVKVDKEYFEDALFIGDSRIEGLRDYSGFTNATFYAKPGITIYNIFEEKIAKIKKGGKSVNTTIPKAMQNKKYTKIYIMAGINELGYKTTSDFGKQYKKVVDELLKYQPDAKIFIMGIMRVTDEYSKKDKVFNNENINDKNVTIAGLANGTNIIYLDFNPEIVDKNNGLKKSYSWDGIHLKAEYYSLWVEFLKQHGI